MGIFKGLMGLFEAKPRSQDRIWKKDSERKKPGARRVKQPENPGRLSLEGENPPVPRETSPQGGMVPIQYPADMEALMAATTDPMSDTARLQQMLGLQQQQMSPYWKQQYGQLGQAFRYPGQPFGDFWRPPYGGGK